MFSTFFLKGYNNVDSLEYPPKVLEVLSLEAFLSTMPGVQMCIFLNNIAHKNHLELCSESRVEGQCFPKEIKKLPVHSKF